jgi:hypothetical protein
LAEWAARRGESEVARLKPGQLYAAILAPVLCGITETIVAELTRNSLDRWLDTLTAAAVGVPAGTAVTVTSMFRLTADSFARRSIR